MPITPGFLLHRKLLIALAFDENDGRVCYGFIDEGVCGGNNGDASNLSNGFCGGSETYTKTTPVQ